MTVAFGSLMPVAVIFKRYDHNLTLHKFLNIYCAVLTFIGLAAVYYVKEQKQLSHFWDAGASWHAIIGGFFSLAAMMTVKRHIQ